MDNGALRPKAISDMRNPVLLFFLLLLPAVLRATDLGEVSVVVADRTPSARDEAVASGLERVLVRLSGDSAARRLPGASSLFSQPSRYLQRYEYELAARQLPQEAEPAADPSAEPDTESSELVLVMRFDVASLVDRMLSLGMPVWSTRRPGVLGWVVLQRPGFGEILGEGSADPLAEALASQARDRGLVLMLPVMDAEDQARISAADVRGRFDRVLEEASSRYRQPLTLTAVIYSGNPVQVRWRLLGGGAERASGDFNADDEAAAVDGLLEALVAVQVADYTVLAGAATDRLLQVEGVTGLPQWQSLMTYLRGLEGMEAVQLTRTTGGRTSVLLRFSGATEQLGRLLAVNRHLQPCAGASAVSSLTAPSDPASTPVGSQDAVATRAEAGPVAESPLPVYCWQP